MGGGISLDRKNYDKVGLAAHKKRTLVSGIMIFTLIPLTIFLTTLINGNSKYMIASTLVLIYTTVPFFMIYEKRKPKAREIVLIAMMSAITTMTHMFFHITIPLQIGTTMVVISGVAMGPEAGFLVGALSRFVCNFYMGQGPWTAWQMFCWGLLGFLAGLFFNRVSIENRFEKTVAEAADFEQGKGGKSQNRKAVRNSLMGFRAVMTPILSVIFGLIIAYLEYLWFPQEDYTFLGWRLYVFGAGSLLVGAILQRQKLPVGNITLTIFTFLTTFILYGGIMNISAMVTAMGLPGMELSWKTLKMLYISGVSYDFAHATIAAICMFIIGKPMINKIERIKVKYGIYR